MKKLNRTVFLLGIVMVVIPALVLAQDVEKRKKKVLKLEKVTVTAPKVEQEIVLTPSTTTINVEKYKIPGTPQNIVDILRDQAIIDFRGYSDLVQTNDNIYMRGFDTRSFVTAIDGLSVEKVGGYKGGHFMDYSLIPFGQIESIEIIPGPHSVLYPGRAIGGVLNIKTKEPMHYETLKPNAKVMASFRSYGTQDYRIDTDGGVGPFNYAFGYRKYKTDGYLRNNEEDRDTVYGRIGYIFPFGGYINFLGSYSDISREIPVKNDPTRADYDSDYPVVADETSRYTPSQEPRREKEPWSIRLNARIPTPIGSWSLGGYYSYEDQGYYFSKFPRGVKEVPAYTTEWHTYGAKIQDEIKLFESNTLTAGFDYTQLRYRWDKIDESFGGYIQDKWKIFNRLTLIAGIRYEDIHIWWNNKNYRTGKYANPSRPQEYIERTYCQFIPKSFITYELDDLSRYLRDTSISLGVSKIWTPKSYCAI